VGRLWEPLKGQSQQAGRVWRRRGNRGAEDMGGSGLPARETE